MCKECYNYFRAEKWKSDNIAIQIIGSLSSRSFPVIYYYSPSRGKGEKHNFT